MRLVLTLLLVLTITSCSITPYEQLNLDTTSNFRKPEEGKAGIYVYQWKTGVIGALFDVDFEIKGEPVISLNTGEYGYFELEPGQYEYKLSGGLFKQFIPVTFEANKNYFFAAQLSNGSDSAVLVRSQQAIDAAKQNIHTERYELHSLD